MIVVTLIACLSAIAFAALAWSQHRDAMRRSRARVAALAAVIDGHAPDAFTELDTFRPEGSTLASASVSAAPSHRWMIAAGIVPAALVVAALLVTRGPTSAPLPALRQPQSLELLAMRHERAGDILTVIGTVRVRGRDTAPVTAIVTGRDADGRVVASGHAEIDDARLDVSGESSFQVAVPDGREVNRYQVRFETPLGPLTHIDRRAQP